MKSYSQYGRDQQAATAAKGMSVKNPFQLVADEDEPLQAKKNPFQLLTEEDDLLQKKSDPAQLLAPDEELLKGK